MIASMFDTGVQAPAVAAERVSRAPAPGVSARAVATATPVSVSAIAGFGADMPVYV